MWAVGSCFLRLIRVGHISRKLYEHLEHGTGCSGTVAIAKTRRQSGHFAWCSWGPSTRYTEVDDFYLQDQNEFGHSVSANLKIMKDNGQLPT
jgi:hypothetical protein